MWLFSVCGESETIERVTQGSFHLKSLCCALCVNDQTKATRKRKNVAAFVNSDNLGFKCFDSILRLYRSWEIVNTCIVTFARA
jgi:hypothetical protein